MSLEKFYCFTETLNGWAVQMTPEFRQAVDDLDQDAIFDDWKTGDALPALPAVYKGKPVVDLSGFFKCCVHVERLDLSLWDTSNVRDMNRMFYGCSNLKEVNCTFDTSRVEDMIRMFGACESLMALDLSLWDVGMVKDMSEMFISCSSLRQLDVATWNTGSVTNMSSMFLLCRSLVSLDLSKWDVSHVTNMSSMFQSCSMLYSLGTLDWDTSSVETMFAMFRDCERLTILDVSSFQTGNVTRAGYLFAGCRSLLFLDLHAWDTEKMKDILSMFSHCSNLICLDLPDWEPSFLTHSMSFLNNCCSLQAVYVSEPLYEALKQFSQFKTKIRHRADVKHPGLDQYPMPDVNLTSADMHQYGYLFDMRLPVGKERALELFDSGFYVNALHPNGSEEVMIDREEILAHNGLFGIFRKNWEQSAQFYEKTFQRKLHQWKREQAFLTYPGDCFAVYQVSYEDTQNLRFMNLKWLKAHDQVVDWKNYDLVYTSPMFSAGDPNLLLEELYRKFNLEKPADFCSPSMSVSDVVALKLNGEISFYYCDSIGFEEVSDFVVNDPELAPLYHALLLHQVELLDTERFYRFVPENEGWRVSLSPEFKNVLDREYPISFAGWDMTDPLPPLPAVYKGKPVVSVSGLFAGCRNIRHLDLSRVDLFHVRDMSRIFFDCSSLESVDGLNNPERLENFSYAFAGCSSMKALEFSRFSFQSVKDLSYAFFNCTSLTSLVFGVRSRFFGKRSFRGIFQNCVSLRDLYLCAWELYDQQILTDMFRGCRSLIWTNHDLAEVVSDWSIRGESDLSGMFEDCQGLIRLDLSRWDVRQVSVMNRMFAGCIRLQFLDISTWKPRRATTMARMFENCKRLANLDISTWNILKRTDVMDAFAGCDSLKRIRIRSERVKERLLAAGLPEAILKVSE